MHMQLLEYGRFLLLYLVYFGQEPMWHLDDGGKSERKVVTIDSESRHSSS